MATPDDATFVQQRLGYSFQNQGILLLALTAAGKGGTGDGEEKRGNSRLAHLGNYLMQFLLAWVGFSEDRSRADTSVLSTRLSSTDHCAMVAEKADLSRCLKYDVRSGSKSAAVLRKALNAIIAAVFVDSRDINIVFQVVLKLGLFGHDEFGVSPKLLSTVDAGSIGGLGNDPQPVSEQEFTASCLGGLAGLTATEQTDLVLTDFQFSGEPDIFTDMPCISTDFFDNFLENSPPARGTEIAWDCTNTANRSRSRPDVTELDSQTVGRAAKRRRPAPGRKAPGVGENIPNRAFTWLSHYLSEERERCISHNIAPPEETFFTKHIEEELRGLGTKHANTSMLVQVSIASSYAFWALRELVCTYKAADDFQFWQVKPTVSAQARFHIIRRLDDKIAGYGILRRYHILHLFNDNVPTNSRVLTNFINKGLDDFQSSKQMGNPSNNAKFEVTCGMMKAIYPELDPSSGEYRSNFKTISRLQILGRRYHALVGRFHKGILALLPPSGLAKPFEMGVSDNMLLALPDTAFSDLLDILDKTQGDLLRRSSEVASRLIEPLIYETPQDSVRFHIEIQEAEDILRHPKGSEELLNLLDLV
ncbi:hypothetical protein BJX99DRAFT_154460 [Aspergillus californicus]